MKSKAHNLTPRRPGDRVLIVIPNYWSSAPTFERAAKRLRGESGVTVTPSTPPTKMRVYSVHPDAYCEEIRGDLLSPKDHPAIALNDPEAAR